MKHKISTRRILHLTTVQTAIMTINNTNINTTPDYTKGAVMTLAVTLGVLGNIPVIVSVCRKRSLLKNNHYYLVLHLAICDLFILLCFVPASYSTVTASPLSSYFLCKIVFPAHTIFLSAAASFLVLISIYRYRAIVHPLKPAVSQKTLKILSIFVYVLAIIYIIPLVLVLRFDETLGCYEEWPMHSLNIAYGVFLLSAQYFIPLLSLSVIYFKICKELISQNNKFKAMNGQVRDNRGPTLFQSVKVRNTKAFIVSFIIVVCFVVSACPTQVIWIVGVINSNELPSVNLWLSALYMFGTSVINPFVYG